MSAIVWNRMARKALSDIMPLEALTGDMPDIAELFDFELREPVRYLENPEIKFPKSKRMLGRWLGIAVCRASHVLLHPDRLRDHYHTIYGREAGRA